MGLIFFSFSFLTGLTFLGLQLDVELLAVKQSPFGYVMGTEKHIGSLVCFLSVVFQFSLAVSFSYCFIVQDSCKNCGRII